MPLLSSGIIVVNKDEGFTSRDVVNKVSRIIKTKKIGHTGTLDPMATGVLVLTYGRYTKLNNFLTSDDKEYVAKMKLGVLTDTLDITGNVLHEEKVNIDPCLIEEAFKNFPKEYIQEVPIYSAVQVDGKRLYDYARNNINIDKLPSKKVYIKELKILSIEDDIILFECVVSKGTYIRSLIRDIASSLNTYATMTELKRTRQGIFKIEDSYTLDNIENNQYKVVMLKDVFNYEIIEVNDELLFKIKNGSKLENNYKTEYVLFTHNKDEIALYKREEDCYKLNVLLDIKK